jgi:hypothetical protein
MVKRLALLGVGLALIACTPTVIGASNQSITAADINEVEALAYRVCAPFARQGIGVEGQDPIRTIKFRIKPVRANCLHVEAFRTLDNRFDIHFVACKHDGKWQIEPAHLTRRDDK